MMASKPTVLFFPYHPTSWPAMFKLALEFQQKGVYRPVMFITEGIKEKQDECRQSGIDCHFFNSDYLLVHADASQSPSMNKKSISNFLEGIKNFCYVAARKIYRVMYSGLSRLERKTNNGIQRFSLYQLGRSFFEFAYYKNAKNVARKILDTYQPKAIFMYVDNAGGVFGCITKECQDRGVKIIIPVVAFQNPGIVATRRSKAPYMKLQGKGAPWINRFLKHILPAQFYRHGNAEVLFYLPYETLAMHWAEILPPFPWVKGKNRCNIICVEDFYQREELEELGVDPQKIIVAGHVDFDDLWSVKNRLTKPEFFKNYGFNESKKLIMIALPQLLYERAVKTREEHNEEIEFLVRAATDTGENLLLLLHPKMCRADYEYLEAKYSCRINRGETSEAIPFGDIYVSAGSSTNFWAISCGLIIINIVQLYGYSVDMFPYLDSIVTVKTKQEFREVISNITCNNEFYIEKQKKVHENRDAYLLPLDGQNAQRYLSLVEEREGAPLLK